MYALPMSTYKHLAGIAFVKACVMFIVLGGLLVLMATAPDAPRIEPAPADWSMAEVVGSAECAFAMDDKLSGLPNAIVTYGKDSAVVLNTDQSIVNEAMDQALNGVDHGLEIKAFCITK